ncbi:MAG: hypothetical protein P0Y55_12595 [Candidatus Cohnella colombiensis]|uniref:Uncharacterized protein n=1 Tax=Candidatus Cohnella colombiensis TaxID=3121368 RepID=A0AA95F2A0_9BACL|nr:MAG: hypothetical protein P0Y55_12595 [Cohnella sp.]
MKPVILPLNELELMDEADKIQTLQQYRAAYTIKELSQAWQLSNPIQYYMWLKKQRVYEHIVRRSDKFEPSKEWKRIQQNDHREWERNPVRGLSADQFRYLLDTESSGPELANVFRRLADFLYSEGGQFRVRVELKALAAQTTADNSLEA